MTAALKSAAWAPARLPEAVTEGYVQPNPEGPWSRM